MISSILTHSFIEANQKALTYDELLINEQIALLTAFTSHLISVDEVRRFYQEYVGL